jgi:hypothetical protein
MGAEEEERKKGHRNCIQHILEDTEWKKKTIIRMMADKMKTIGEASQDIGCC